MSSAIARRLAFPLLAALLFLSGLVSAFVHPKPFHCLQVLGVSKKAPKGSSATNASGNDQNETLLLGNVTLAHNYGSTRMLDENLHRKWTSSAAKAAGSVFFGTILTFALNNHLSLGPIKASCTVGLLAALTLEEKSALGAFLGSFAGMARLPVIPSFTAAILLGLLSAAMMTLCDNKRWFIGLGGRLGFIAQVSCTTQYLLSRIIGRPNTGAALIGKSSQPIGHQIIPTCLATIFGALLVSAWKEAVLGLAKATNLQGKWKTLSDRLSTSVAAASVTGGMMSFFPVALAGPAYCGAFVAMSSPQKIETYGGLVGASACAGFVQVLLAATLIGGWGGKLGTAAFLGVVVYRSVMKQLPLRDK
mmetsp:Transcript_46644/g.134337  ORF Transcript_46644/g.134337 Transcript_46644/m.134337 type:complete len:362 (-) Transcript_46644:1617-2702(-)